MLLPGNDRHMVRTVIAIALAILAVILVLKVIGALLHLLSILVLIALILGLLYLFVGRRRGKSHDEQSDEQNS